ncbi:lysylphosphatidylglycerol synthase transmembrane domain-containing protein [Nostocoides sp. F2B08]|uniref:lysylphosphatidylglycerol synthase transmembrane domain-containing protein n=1 Tax=Nostocoides sp. F2B08 TaxID=2653936 RepID=UPI00186B14DB|nr:lysylphosphatidylglycerol synthase transmembrane domain-containing protein [Tetrasphaera sp. F2B08]
MTPSGWRWIRPLVGAVILGLVVAQIGAAAFREGLRALDTATLVVGVLLAALTTVCSAWRWRLVADRLSAGLPLSLAVASYYRSLLLNLTLPGGVLGDVDRGVRHGRRVDDVRVALRAVVWERVSGQVVLIGLAVLAVLFTPVPEPARALVAGGLVLIALLAIATVRHAGSQPRPTVRRFGPIAVKWPEGKSGLPTRVATVALADGRALASPRVVLGLLGSSLIAISGHVATFVVAARAVGTAMPVTDLVIAAVLVLLVAAVPLSLAGWGPREGAAAWVFAATGAQASEGLAVSVAYGSMVLVGALPGLFVILAGRSRTSAVSARA